MHGMPDGSVREARDADRAVAVGEDAHVRDEELAACPEESAEACPIPCLAKIVLCVIRYEAPDLRGGQCQAIGILTEAAEDIAVFSVFNLLIYLDGRFGSCLLGLVAAPILEGGVDIAEHVFSGGKRFGTLGGFDDYALACGDEPEAADGIARYRVILICVFFVHVVILG